MRTIRRVFGQPPRRRMLSVFVLGLAVIGVAVTAAVAIQAVREESPSDPAGGTNQSPSPWPVPAPCLTGDGRSATECGWLLWADLDGDGERDQLALIVSLAPSEDGFHRPEHAELRARLASGQESSVAVEVNPLAGFPQVLPEQASPGDQPGVLDLDGDGRDEVLLSPFQSAAGRLFVRLFVWDTDGLREVSAAGESSNSPRREALTYGDGGRSGLESFEFIVGGSAGFGGGLRCANVDSDAENELLLRFYRYANDPAYYLVTEAAYDLDQARATELSTQTETVAAEVVDDTFRSLMCGSR